MASLYCGIDFHKHTSTICVLTKDGEQVEMTTVRTANLVKYLSNRRDYLIGIEASGGTNAIVQKLKDSGHQVKIINPNAFKAIGLGGKKTDKRDAKALAEALRLNYIPEVYHKGQYAREIKSPLVSREQIVRTRVNLVNHVRGILREYGTTMPQGMENFWKNIVNCLDELDCQYISGDKRRMGKITRSGSEVLRRYLIHGARSVLLHTHEGKIRDRNRQWAFRVKQRAGMNKATVALAHRMARTAFSMLKENTNYQLQLPLEDSVKEAA